MEYYQDTPYWYHKKSLCEFKNYSSYTKYVLCLHGMKLDMSKKNIFGESQNIWKLYLTHLNNLEIKEAIKRKITKHFELEDNENSHQILWYRDKVLRGTFIALNTY